MPDTPEALAIDQVDGWHSIHSHDLLSGDGDCHFVRNAPEGARVYLGGVLDGVAVDVGPLTEQPDAWFVLRRTGADGIDEDQDYIVPAWKLPS